MFLFHGTLGESLFYYYFIYLSYFGSAGSSLLRVSSLAVASRGSSLVTAHRPLIVVTSLDAERRLYGMQASMVAACGLNSCGSQVREHRLNIWLTGFVALWCVGSSRTRDRTHVSCIGRQVLYP